MTQAAVLAQIGNQNQTFRNRIINGAMMIDQRNAGASVTPASPYTQYSVDRFYALLTVGSKFSIQQNAGAVTPPSGFTNYLGATSLSAYSVGTGDVFGIAQAVEGFNISDLAWGSANAATVTLSFWVRCSLTGTFGGALQNGAQNYSYPFTYTINSANTWEQKTITIAGPTSGSWTTNNTAGIVVNFGLGAGSTSSGTAGSWTGADKRTATGATSVVGTNGATFYITGVQLEKGTVATPFEQRLYGTELALCQRYYFKDSAVSSLVFNASGTYSSYQFKTSMRIAPTVTAAYAAGSVSVNGFYAQSGGITGSTVEATAEL